MTSIVNKTTERFAFEFDKRCHNVYVVGWNGVLYKASEEIIEALELLDRLHTVIITNETMIAEEFVVLGDKDE